MIRVRFLNSSSSMVRNENPVFHPALGRDWRDHRVAVRAVDGRLEDADGRVRQDSSISTDVFHAPLDLSPSPIALRLGLEAQAYPVKAPVMQDGPRPVPRARAVAGEGLQVHAVHRQERP